MTDDVVIVVEISETLACKLRVWFRAVWGRFGITRNCFTYKDEQPLGSK